MNRTEHKKKAVLRALEASLGVVTTACKDAQISRTTFYAWVEDDPSFAAAVLNLNEVALDFAESQLFKQMKAGNATSTIFYLKTRGRSRGYIEQQLQEDAATLHSEW